MRFHASCLLLLLLAVSTDAAEPFVSKGFLKLPAEVKLGEMSSVAIDAKDNIFVLHRGEPGILMFDAEQKFVRGFGEGMFKLAHGLRVDAEGHIWTTDNANHAVRKFNREGKLLLTLGTVGKAGGGKEGFRSPDDLVFDSEGNIYVADAGNGRIVKLDKDGVYVSEFGKKGKADGQFATAHGIAIDKENRIYVADRGNKRAQVFDSTGKHLANFTGFGNPFGLLVIGEEVLATEGDIHKIFVLDRAGKITGSFGDPKTLLLPHLMAVNSRGELFVTEVKGKRVQIFQRP